MQQWLKQHPHVLWFLLLLLSPSGHAGGDPAPPIVNSTTHSAALIQPIPPFPVLAPFKAYYQAQFDLGISMEGEAIRQLQALKNGQWQLSLHAKAMIASIDESSRFQLPIQQHQIRPLQYNYQRKVLGKKKQRQLDFDWQQGTIASRYNDSSTSLALELNTLDTISYQIQLWHDLKAGKPNLEYQVADGGRVKQYRFKRLNDETITTPAGSFDAIKVARDRGKDSGRQTYIWFAKTHDHVIVKLEQIETDGKQYTLLLERIE